MALEAEYAQCEEALASAGDDADAMQDALNRMAELQTQLDAADATAVERKVDKILGAMGFTADDASLPVSAFSGGWKMRIGLGKILLQEPQVLLLDEPTNHMDLESVEWLERYLVEQTSNLALVIVSHDREFLDRVCTRIVETEQGVAYAYNGNYRTFLQQKEARVAIQQKDYDAQRKEVRALKNEINKLRPLGESAAGAIRTKERSLAELEEGGAKHVPRPFVDKKKFSFRFPPSPRCSQEVIELEGLAHGYGGSTLFKDIDLCIERGDRIAILGPNGAGKSTLLRLIMGTEKPREGSAEIVASNAVPVFFEQDQANVLPLDKSVIQTMEAAAASTDFVYEQLRALLGRFMFKDDKVNDKLSTLSGGEKARVALCRMILLESNLLLLDEPTNHLDIAAKEVRERARMLARDHASPAAPRPCERARAATRVRDHASARPARCGFGRRERRAAHREGGHCERPATTHARRGGAAVAAVAAVAARRGGGCGLTRRCLVARWAWQVLEEAIHHYEGTVVMVSHDRYFVSQTANTILALEDGALVVYDGDYKSYMEANADTAEKVEARYIPGLSTIKKAPKIEIAPQETEMKAKKKKNFGGKGGPSGNKMKGIKNAKRSAALP